MFKNTINTFALSASFFLSACGGEIIVQPNPKTSITDSLSTQNTTSPDNSQTDDKDLIKIYSRAISDYITEVNKQGLIAFDTLYFGKHKYGQPDDFPDISLPNIIKNINIQLIAPEVGKKLQEEKKSRVYINLMGWVDKDHAEFIFVTFSNGFQHKFDYHIEYNYNPKHKEFDLTKISEK